MNSKHLLSLCAAMLIIVTISLYLANCVPTASQGLGYFGGGSAGEISYNSSDVPSISSKYTLK